MEKLWLGRQEKALDASSDELNSSLRFDCRMYKEDIAGSVAHAAMLAHRGIVTQEEGALICEGLTSILEDLESGKLTFSSDAEDIHTFIENELTARIGQPGKKLHTGRSRNDQVATDLRLYLRNECRQISSLIADLICAVKEKAEETAEMIMPGYTHLQRAQPITMGHQLLSYAMMLLRDLERLKDAAKRMNRSPLGCAALAGTTYQIDRRETAAALGFEDVCANSIDGVSDRDFVLELLSVFSILMMHLSRFSEEIVLWSSWEFRFIELDDAFTTGSSIMPQKKNPDVAELVRGKTGRVYGDLVTMLTVMKGLPLAYNKDLQEDKEAIFDALDTVKLCLKVFAPMVRTVKPLPENMHRAAENGFINATDLADWLTGKGLPFRTAYKLVGQTVAHCLKTGRTLESLPLEEYKALFPEADESLYEALRLENCVKRRISEGGTSPFSLKEQISRIDSDLCALTLQNG